MALTLGADRKRLIERRTNIVASVEPASSRIDALRNLVASGVDAVRLNFSHGTHEGHAESIPLIRRAAHEAGRHVAVLADLCGPKIRCGQFVGGSIELTAGEPVVVTVGKVRGRPGLIPSEYETLAEDVAPGTRILLDDGRREIRVTSTGNSRPRFGS